MTFFGIHALGHVSALGIDEAETARRLFSGESLDRVRLTRLRGGDATVTTFPVWEDLPELPTALAEFRCRNHRLAYAAWLQIETSVLQAKQHYGAHRIGVVIGSSTSGMDATDTAWFQWRQSGELPASYSFHEQYEMVGVARLIGLVAGVTGPTLAVSTACTSGAKAFASAAGLLATGWCDAVIVGGADTLCDLTLSGFNVLDALAPGMTNPFSANREGLNLGEGAALFLLSREPAPVGLLGVGESSDAHHMSAPHPEGIGAEAAMRAALLDACLEPEQIDYLNLHGTGTRLNDHMESLAVARVLPAVACSSTKPLTGHTLGAAGALEAAFCYLTLKQTGDGMAQAPPHIWDGARDGALVTPRLIKVGAPKSRTPAIAMSNSFAFGGNNCSLILAQGPSSSKLSTQPLAVNDAPFGVAVSGWSAWAPGLPDSEAWTTWLRSGKPLPEGSPDEKPACKSVNAMLRRRFGMTTRMVLASALAACEQGDVPAHEVLLIHGSRYGEMAVLVKLLACLEQEASSSPTHFSNSVFNTPAGYFGLATGNCLLTRSISAGPDTFVSCWLEAVSLLTRFPDRPVLLVIADEVVPQPFCAGLSFNAPHAAAFLLRRTDEPGAESLSFERTAEAAPQSDEPAVFQFLRWLVEGKQQLILGTSFGGCQWHR